MSCFAVPRCPPYRCPPLPASRETCPPLAPCACADEPAVPAGRRRHARRHDAPRRLRPAAHAAVGPPPGPGVSVCRRGALLAGVLHCRRAAADAACAPFGLDPPADGTGWSGLDSLARLPCFSSPVLCMPPPSISCGLRSTCPVSSVPLAHLSAERLEAGPACQHAARRARASLCIWQQRQPSASYLLLACLGSPPGQSRRHAHQQRAHKRAECWWAEGHRAPRGHRRGV